MNDAPSLLPASRGYTSLSLKLETIFHFAIVALGPHRKIGLRIDELRGDAKTIACAAEAAGENVGGTELLADLLRRDLLIAKRQDCVTRESVQAADFRKFGDDVFGDAVAKVFVFFRAAEILEIQHCDGLRTNLGHA